jgi:cyclin-dependent kinase 12/13
MGGICTKASSAVEDRDSQASSRKRLSSLSRRSASELRVNSSRRHDGIRGNDRLGLYSDEVKAMRIDRKANGSIRFYDDQIEKKRREKSEVSAIEHPGLGRVPKAIHGEQIAAGWPAWLSSVAGEAIKGWIPRRANTFEKLEKVCSIFSLMLDYIHALQFDHWYCLANPSQNSCRKLTCPNHDC